MVEAILGGLKFLRGSSDVFSFSCRLRFSFSLTKYQRVLVSFLELENFSLKKRSRISIMPLYYLTFCIMLRSGAMLPNVIFCQL